MIASIRLARERQVKMRVQPTGVAATESVELARHLTERFARFPERSMKKHPVP
jgi:hypothetical protein